MTILRWTDALSVNINEIDQQHKQLIIMVNELNEAMRKRKAKDVLGEIIDGLINYAATHFATEEKYFDKYDYPATETHKKEHAGFVEKVIEFKLGFDEGRILLSLDVMNFLQEWLLNHIQVSDKKYCFYFAETGRNPTYGAKKINKTTTTQR